MRLGGRAGAARATAVRGWGRQPRQYAGIPVPSTRTGILPPECTERQLAATDSPKATPHSWGLYANLVPGTGIPAYCSGLPQVRAFPSTSLRAGRTTTRGTAVRAPPHAPWATGGVPRCVDAASLPRAACARLRRGPAMRPHPEYDDEDDAKVLGILLVLVGTVWILRGSTCCGELMTGQMKWRLWCDRSLAGLLLFLAATARRLTVVGGCSWRLQLAVAVGGCSWRLPLAVQSPRQGRAVSWALQEWSGSRCASTTAE